MKQDVFPPSVIPSFLHPSPALLLFFLCFPGFSSVVGSPSVWKLPWDDPDRLMSGRQQPQQCDKQEVEAEPSTGVCCWRKLSSGLWSGHFLQWPFSSEAERRTSSQWGLTLCCLLSALNQVQSNGLYSRCYKENATRSVVPSLLQGSKDTHRKEFTVIQIVKSTVIQSVEIDILNRNL